ncbi:hypothetical protein [Hymenobacter metallilatus]|uniref:Uncharacterized protein n=1 Tax=Hymenobacter metallilatus TaxID=2493666 RepID=A0A3R9MYR8_9BACT|nr:hypothetical protein [Hymenobacter metallilatus]RSK33955.1 hypothetical protein EI290_09625 [Hymenobacter metallilatus]
MITKAYKITIDGQEALATTGQLKKEIERLEEELDKVQLGSPEADAYVRELGKAKAALKGLEESIDVAFDKDKAGAFVDAAAGLAGAFEVGTVAATNFGLVSAESAEAYQKRLTELIAVVQGLEAVHKLTTNEVSTALKGAWSDAKRVILGYLGIGEAATASGTAAATSGKVARLALASIGIGVLLLLLGLVVTNWDKITGAVERNREKVVGALKYISPPIYGLISLLDEVTKRFGGLSQLASGLGAALVESFSVAGDVLGKLLQGDVTGALDEARKFGTRTSEAFDKGVTEKNAELAEERDRKEAVGRAERLKRQIAEEEAAGREVFALKKRLLDEEIKQLDKSAADYATKLADKQSEIRALTNAHTKQLADDAEKARKEEEAKQKAATEKAQKEAEERYAKLRAAQKEASEKELAANEEERKRRIALSRATGGSQQAILRAEIDAAKDAQVELLLNGKGFGSDYLALKEEIRVKEQQIIDANLADQKKALDDRAALQSRELADLDEVQFGRLSRLQRAGASEQQLDKQRLDDLRERQKLMEKFGLTASRAFQEVLNSIDELEKKLKPKTLTLGQSILKALFGLTNEAAGELAGALTEIFGQVYQAAQIFNDLFFQQADERLAQQIQKYDDQLAALQDRGKTIEQELADATRTREQLEKDVDSQRGARREATIARIAKERAEESRLAREKAKNDAEQLKAAKLKEDAEKRRQELQKQSQILSESAQLAANGATAAEAILAGVRAVSGANAIPFPGNLIAVVSALAATASAIASAKKLGATIKGANGGLLEGPSHALGGIRGTGRFANVEVEGGEALTNRQATANNLSTLATINKYGARVQFVAIPRALVRGTSGGQLSTDGGLDVATANGGDMVTVPAAQLERTNQLLEQLVGHAAITATKEPFVFDGPNSRRIADRADQEKADAGGGRLF